jgi:hypothetical protein
VRCRRRRRHQRSGWRCGATASVPGTRDAGAPWAAGIGIPGLPYCAITVSSRLTAASTGLPCSFGTNERKRPELERDLAKSKGWPRPPEPFQARVLPLRFLDFRGFSDAVAVGKAGHCEMLPWRAGVAANRNRVAQNAISMSWPKGSSCPFVSCGIRHS